MRSVSKFAFLTALLVTVWIVPGLSQDPPKTEVPPAVEPPPQEGADYQAKSLKATLLITADPASNLAHAALLSSVASDPALARQALKVVEKAAQGPNGAPKAAEKPAGELMIRHAISIAPGLAMLEVRARALNDGDTAEEIVSKYANELTGRLMSLDMPHKLLLRRMRYLDDTLKQLDAELKKDKESLVKMAHLHRMLVDPQANEQRRARVDAQLETISVEMAGLNARQRVLEAQIAKLSKSSDEAEHDPVLEELEKAVELRSSTLAKLKTLRGAGSVGEAQVIKAELELIAAKAELAKYRREAGQLGNQRMTELRRRLDDTTIEMGEATAKQGALQAARELASAFSSDIDSRRLQIEQRENEYRAISAELAAGTQQIQRYIHPSVTVLSPQ